MKNLKRSVFIRGVFLFLTLVFASLAGFAWFYGGYGVPYPDLSTPPLLESNQLETVAVLNEPPGNLAVSEEGRVFFNFHTEGRPDKIKLAELINGQPVPFPNEQAQKELFDSVFSIRIDRQRRLWTLDHGFHGLRTPRLMAFDLDSGKVVHDFIFTSDSAGVGSFLNDFQVDSQGQKIYIADTSFFAKKPAVLVYEILHKRATRFLENHASLLQENWLIQTPQKAMVFAGGLFAMRPAVDSIALDKNDHWLYYGAMSGANLYRIPAQALSDSIPDFEIQQKIESMGPKPLSDGMTIDLNETLYIADIEHSSIFIMNQKKELKTLIRNDKIRWADGFSFGPDQFLYLTDSALPDVTLRTKDHIRKSGPYHIFRVKVSAASIPGH